MERPFIVHLDPHLLVVDKPAGLPSVPGRTPELQDCAASRVQALYGDALVVHRLDMATSGLLLFARGLQAQRVLNRAFEQRRVEKAYVAVVRGRPPQARGSIALPLIADWPRRPRQMVDLEPVRTSCACTSRPSATPFWATTCTRTKTPTLARAGCCCTPRRCRFPTPTPSRP